MPRGSGHGRRTSLERRWRVRAASHRVSPGHGREGPIVPREEPSIGDLVAYDRGVADWKRGVRKVLYPAYEARMLRRMPANLPKHIGVMLDGNRRWAKAVGRDTAHGHRAGAANIEPLLTWCDEVGIEVVTLWLLSTDNLNRPDEELEPLLEIIVDAVDSLADQRRWRLHPVGALDLLPAATAKRLKAAAEATSDVDGMIVNVAVAYGGRREIADAVRSLLQEHAAKGTSLEDLAQRIDIEHIEEHLYTKGQPDPDLVIRTSGEQRLGGFLLWQSAKSEFYFCEAYWPDFRRVDFLRAIRAYALRERRFGT
ncbi:isoprenyl transferase [Nocardioides sp.]|nr:isoprenyl transferase [Nocardioides sp.]